MHEYYEDVSSRMRGGAFSPYSIYAVPLNRLDWVTKQAARRSV